MGAKNSLAAKITYLGGIEDENEAVSLTGSATDVSITRGNKEIYRFLVDFGGFQGGKNDYEKSKELPTDFKKIKSILVTHAHFDHIGRLPLLIKNGWIGDVYMTAITKKLTLALLEDSYNIAKMEYEKAQKYNESVGKRFRTYLTCVALYEKLSNNLKKKGKENIKNQLKAKFKELGLEIKNFGDDVIKKNIKKIKEELNKKNINGEHDIKNILKPENPPLYSKDDIKALEAMIKTVNYNDEVVLYDKEPLNWENLNLEELLDSFKQGYYVDEKYIYPSSLVKLRSFLLKYQKVYQEIDKKIKNFLALRNAYLEFFLERKIKKSTLKKLGVDSVEKIEQILKKDYLELFKFDLLAQIKPDELKQKLARYSELLTFIENAKKLENFQVPETIQKEFNDLKSFFEKNKINPNLEIEKIYALKLPLEKIYPSDNYIKFFDMLKEKEQIKKILEKFTPVFGNNFGNKFLYKITAKFVGAGHIEGSAQIIVKFYIKKKQKNPITGQDEYKSYTQNFLFSGDLGRIKEPNLSGSPVKITEPIKGANVEGTYSNRDHDSKKLQKEKLYNILQESKGPVLVAVFSLQRLQEVMKDIIDFYQDLYEKIKSEINSDNSKEILKKLSPIYVDTSLGKKVNEIFLKYNPERYEFLQQSKKEIYKLINQPVEHHDLIKIHTSKQNKFVILSSAGMLNGGFVLDHLKKIVENPSATLVLTGYQGENTLGRKLLEIAQGKQKAEIVIDDKTYKVKCKIVFVAGYSSHADHKDLIEYVSRLNFAKDAVLALVHGGENRNKLAEDLRKLKKNLKIVVPRLGDSIEFNNL